MCLVGINKQNCLIFFKDSHGNKITDSNKIANNFDDFFTNIGTKLANKINHPILIMFLHFNLKINKID